MATEEAVVEAVEETVEAIERIPKADLNGTTKLQQWVILGVTAAVAAASSGGLSYFFTKRHFKLYYEELATKEIEEAKDFYARRNKAGEFADPVHLAEGLAPEHQDQIVRDEGYATQEGEVREAARSFDPENIFAQGATTPPPELMQPVDDMSDPDGVEEKATIDRGPIVNIFEGRANDPNMLSDEILSHRAGSNPYIITELEFNQNDRDFEQMTLTYYEQDDVLADDRDVVIEDSDGSVGDDNLERFGTGSADPNTVHVRNERLELDYEIVRHTGSYAQIVHDVDPRTELKHSEIRGRSRRMRPDDG